jgi:ribonucleoside-diphosphate reductase alpha chain
MEKKAYTPIIPVLTKNAITVLERRYLKRDKEGKILETPTQMFWRVADTIAAADKKFNAKAETDQVAQDF